MLRSPNSLVSANLRPTAVRHWTGTFDFRPKSIVLTQLDYLTLTSDIISNIMTYDFKKNILLHQTNKGYF